jgi:phage FluMu gp28-like protein
MNSGRQIILVSTGQRIAAELLGKWYDMMYTLPNVLQPKFKKHSIQEAELDNNARIMSLPSSDPGTIRGFGMRGPSTDVYVDEYAHVANDRELWIVVRDFQILGGRITLNSTPKGKRGMYCKIVEPLQVVYRGLGPPIDTTWSYHEIPFWFCPRLAKQEKALREGMTDIDFQQEYCTEFIDESLSFFPYELIWNNQKITEFMPANFKTKNPVYFGIDFGKTTSETIIYIAEETAPEHFRTIYIEILPGVNYDEQINTIGLLNSEYNPTMIKIDATGPGGQTMRDLLTARADFGYKIFGFDLNSGVKENIIIRLRMLMQREKVDLPKKDIPEGEQLERQLHSIKRTTTETGMHTRYSGKETGMDDMVWALALAVYKEFTFEFEPMVVQVQDPTLAKLQEREERERTGVIAEWATM